jgi:5,6-dimethylbenzimidazole synthase
MPETVRYSTVLAIGQLWLHARALGLGLGWVSILNPKNINQILQAPKNWDLIAYLCLGYPKLNSQIPYLEEVNWQSRDAFKEFIIYR